MSLFRGHFNIPLVHVDASRPLPRRARRRHRPRGQAQDHRRALHRGVRGGGQEARRRRVPGPGHALSRRDRERVVHRRPVGDHQVAPQRRRPARAHEPASSSSPCASCSRTRCARSAASSACPSTSSAAIRSPGPASPSASPARSRDEKLEILRKADAIYLDEIRKAGLYDKIWQAFAVLLPVRTVGVMGDAPHLRPRLRAARRHLHRRHDGRLSTPSPTTFSADAPPASSTRSRASTASSTTSPRKPPGTIEWE